MAKRSKKAQEPEVNRKQASRRARDERQRRWILVGAAAVFVVAAIVGAFGLYQELVAKPSQPVARVNGEGLALGDYADRVALQRYLLEEQLRALEARQRMDPEDPAASAIPYLSYQLGSLASTVYDQLIDEAILRQEAEKAGISISAEEVTVAIEEAWGYRRNPLSSPDELAGQPARTLEEYQTQYGEYLSRLEAATGVGEQAYRRMVEAELLRSRMVEPIAGALPTAEEQVRARHILVETEEEAEQALDRLRAGEVFTDVAREVSQDPGSAQQGGDLGWFGRGQMVPSFEDAAFALQPGELSEPISSTFGYHIIQVEERDPARELSPETLSQREAAAFQQWLAEQRASEGVERLYSAEELDALLASQGS